MRLKPMTLKKMVCEPCGKHTKIIDLKTKTELKAQLPSWQLVSNNKIEQLQKTYTFKNFILSLEFANKVGQLAEEYDHHPEITVKWGESTIVWWTHAVNGLHENDFILAAKTDDLSGH
jgi:4a-hydroxytetrahydrobiopterin dehydratase